MELYSICSFFPSDLHLSSITVVHPRMATATNEESAKNDEWSALVFSINAQDDDNYRQRWVWARKY